MGFTELMMRRNFGSLPLCFCFVLAVCFLAAGTASAQRDWLPVSPEELSMKTSTVEPGADAEILNWDVRIDDSSPERMVKQNYVRVKILTEKGQEKFSKVDIPYRKGIKIRNIKARVIKPDGSITELEKSDVFDQEIVRADKIKVRAKSFAIPGIEPGVVVEYRFQEEVSGASANNMRMEFQQDVPIRKKSYYFRPWADARVLTFNMPDKGFQKDKGGFYRATMENVKSVKTEPHMPPIDEIQSWILVYYASRQIKDSGDFWARYGGVIVQVYDVKKTLKPGKDITLKAEELTAGVTDPMEKIRRLFDFCKAEIKNLDYDTALTEEEKDDLKPSKSPLDTLRKKQGTTADINELFGSLAAATGLETRYAFTGDRSEKFFSIRQAHQSFVHFAGIAVKINDRWTYFSPGDYFVPFGMLDWREQDTAALLLGWKDYITIETPLSGPSASKATRRGNFKLSEDGTLEGEVEIAFTGHLSTRHKLDNYRETENKREEILKELVRANISTAEVSDISIMNLNDPEKPFTYKYKIKVPGYATKVGRRMLFQPGVFERGSSPVFSSETRSYQVFFHYPWSHDDEIRIKLPEGFELDGAETPMPVKDAANVGNLEVSIGIDKASQTLVYRRKFHFGGGGNTLFSPQVYPALKGMFDRFHDVDSHQLAIATK